MPKSKPEAFLYPAAWGDLDHLSGTVRRQMIRAMDTLAQNPRPPASKQLDIPNEPVEVRRYSIGHWRIIYAVEDEHALILAIRRRPPYNYEDLEQLLKEL